MTPEQIQESRSIVYNAVQDEVWRLHNEDDPTIVVSDTRCPAEHVAEGLGVGRAYEIAEFIVHASTALPQALDAIEASDAEIARLRRVLESETLRLPTCTRCAALSRAG